MRKLASVEVIDKVIEHPNADALSIYKVKGWNVVGRLGEYKEGDLAVFFEVDSWIPHTLAPFLTKGKVSVYDGIEGNRLRTIRLRGQLSQGLLLPIDILEGKHFEVGEDVSEYLGITKWEKPIPLNLQGQVRGTFPHFIRKTDQERVQNIPESTLSKMDITSFEVTEKIDGSSMTIYFHEGEWGVTSRNVDLKLDQEGNHFVEMFKSLKNELDVSVDVNFYHGISNFAFQGELCGEGIQGNPYKLKGQKYLVYNIWDIDKQTYIPPNTAREIVSRSGLDYVPLLEGYDSVPLTHKDLLEAAEGKSELYSKAEREGIVFKSADTSFKVISNKWLLKEE